MNSSLAEPGAWRWLSGVNTHEESMPLFAVKPFLSVLIGMLALCCTLTTYAADSANRYTEKGKATYYADKTSNKKTASGELYRHDLNTAAHKTLPFGTHLKVTNPANGKSVVVRVNDRGPFTKGRIVDLSKSAFSSIGRLSAGALVVEIEVVD